MNSFQSQVPVIDVGPLVNRTSGQNAVAEQINNACRQSGFFYVVGHCVDDQLIQHLCELSREFFAFPREVKNEIAMVRAGRAWRGYFNVGDELTSGLPDQKEGIYFGAELPPNHPLVMAETPLHGPNLFPPHPLGFDDCVLEYMSALTQLGHSLMAGIALAIGLDETFFEVNGVADPLTLFRIFSYPPTVNDELWGVGEHTDYGLLTILLQDDVGGLEVKTTSGWMAAPPLKGSFVCNIGDMLDRMTRGVYRSTPHRVRNSSSRHRLSFPFFYDPNFNASVRPIEMPNGEVAADDLETRWDKSSVHHFAGTYGDYLLGKVGKVFPGLKTQAL